MTTPDSWWRWIRRVTLKLADAHFCGVDEKRSPKGIGEVDSTSNVNQAVTDSSPPIHFRQHQLSSVVVLPLLIIQHAHQPSVVTIELSAMISSALQRLFAAASPSDECGLVSIPCTRYPIFVQEVGRSNAALNIQGDGIRTLPLLRLPSYSSLCYLPATG